MAADDRARAYGRPCCERVLARPGSDSTRTTAAANDPACSSTARAPQPGRRIERVPSSAVETIGDQSLLRGLRLALVFGSDQECLHTTTREILPKGSDGGGDAVDSWEIDVGDEEDAHELPMYQLSDKYLVDHQAEHRGESHHHGRSQRRAAIDARQRDDEDVPDDAVAEPAGGLQDPPRNRESGPVGIILLQPRHYARRRSRATRRRAARRPRGHA